MLWNEKNAAEATGGVASDKWQASRVEIDSRRVQKGDLFVALKGERFDGHKFVQAAFEKGAVAVMVSKATAGPTLKVSDTHKGLEALGKHARDKSSAAIVGVTGSVGKTSTKEMIRLALAAHGETYATSGNFNNHIGTPLSLANFPASAKFGVFEMGMNHAGEISKLTKMVQPHIAVITNVEAVHAEFFESIEAIADAKAEIFEGIIQGTAILNADNVHFARLKSAAEAKGLRVVTCGASGDCKILSYKTIETGSAITVEIFGKTQSITLAATGEHWAQAVLFAITVAHVLNLDLEKTSAGLSTFQEPEGRGRSTQLISGAMLIDDSYNASPASMRAAFAKTVELWKIKGSKGRKLAALGDMLELGKDSLKLHAALAEALQVKGFDRVYTAGTAMQALHDALPSAIHAVHVGKALELAPHLAKDLKPDDVLLVKGSHGSKIYELADALKRGV